MKPGPQRLGFLRRIRQTQEGYWLCRCVCGNEIEVPESWLLSGVAKSCGCKKSNLRNLTGQRFGQLTVIEPQEERTKCGRVSWLCRCDCGAYTIKDSGNLLSGRSKSCGCLRKKVAIKNKTFIDDTCVKKPPSDKPYDNSTSGIRGVTKKRNKWQARVSYAGKLYYLGTFDTIQQAAAARQKAIELLKEHLQTRAKDPNDAADIDELILTTHYPGRHHV